MRSIRQIVADRFIGYVERDARTPLWLRHATYLAFTLLCVGLVVWGLFIFELDHAATDEVQRKSLRDRDNFVTFGVIGLMIIAANMVLERWKPTYLELHWKLRELRGDQPVDDRDSE
jgi:hypothetical protein